MLYRKLECIIWWTLELMKTPQTGAVRIPKLPFYRLVGAVSNGAYTVRLKTPLPGGESVYLFSEFTIDIHQAIVGSMNQE